MSDLDTSRFLASFFDEAKGRLASVNRRLVLLESEKLDAEGVIFLKRDLHTIKGAAQMLDVQDISTLSHLFEDAVELAVAQGPSQQPVLQLLFDLHDQLETRLIDVDAEPRIDTKPFMERLQSITKQHERAAVKIRPTAAERPKRARKKKVRINKNLIAAVMGTIEGSMQPEKSVEPEPTETTGNQQIQDKPAVDYRPKLSQIELTNHDQEEVSGSYFRVDRSRLTSLSNQIIEFSSDRYRADSLETELNKLHTDLKSLKQSISSDQQHQMTQGMAWHALFDQKLNDIQRTRDTFRTHQKRSSIMLDSLRNQVFGLILRPLDSIFSLFPRAARETALRSGKKVQLLVAGESVEMDQIAAEALSEPLIHLINNAIAHGIETPAERIQAGKPEEGQITIYAHKSTGGHICIEVMDDGKGIDIGLVREKALATGLISQSESSEMDESELLELIFHSGFSTLSEADASAGRGAGLNVVLSATRELTGTIHIQTQQGKGSKFTLTLPATVTLQKAVEFIFNGKRFGLLSNLIAEVLPLNQQEIKRGQGAFSQGYINYSGHRVPVIELQCSLAGSTPQLSSTSSIVIVTYLESYLGIVVDELFKEKEIIVRELDPYLAYYQPLGLMGNAIADDGRVLLLLEPNGLKEMWRTAPDTQLDEVVLQSRDYAQRMLLVDDSPIALRLSKSMFECMGFDVDCVTGGAAALEKLHMDRYKLVVTDLDMPAMNGFELTKKVKSLNLDMPVLMLATRSRDDEHENATKAGVDRYLIKRNLKGHEDELIAALDDLLHKPKDNTPIV